MFSLDNKGSSHRNDKKIDIKASFSGSFYSSKKLTLLADLDRLFSMAKPYKEKGVSAIIVPHAGYVYSGGVAASGYNQINKETSYKTVFVIASTHRYSFEGASIYHQGNYVNTLGAVETDSKIGEELSNKYSFFRAPQSMHFDEHVIEVQLPFIQYHIKLGYKIVPIIIGTQKPDVCKKIAEALMPYYTSENLFIISADFSHYSSYKDAIIIDRLTKNAILSNDPEKLLNTIKQIEKHDFANLATPLCSWTSVLTLMFITQNTNSRAVFVDYKNSGDNGGDLKKVVGYNSIVFVENQTEEFSFSLTNEDKKALLTLARNTIRNYVSKNKKAENDICPVSENLKQKAGAFVTLYKRGTLRGCIGHFSADKTLNQVVKEMSIASASQDSRFENVSIDEIDSLNIEISVLSPMNKIKNIDQIILGKHGIYIKKGFDSGTFLPQVAIETNWTKDEFLGHCSRDKMEIGWDGWKSADIYIYTTEVFGENEFNH